MSNFTDVIKTINRMPADKAAEMFQRMTADPEAVERDVAAWAKVKLAILTNFIKKFFNKPREQKTIIRK